MNDKILPVLVSKYECLAYLGDYEKSLNGFENIEKLNFDDYSFSFIFYSSYGSVLEKMKRFNDALKVYDDFLENYPYNEEIQKDRDELLKKINKEKTHVQNE